MRFRLCTPTEHILSDTGIIHSTMRIARPSIHRCILSNTSAALRWCLWQLCFPRNKKTCQEFVNTFNGELVTFNLFETHWWNARVYICEIDLCVMFVWNLDSLVKMSEFCFNPHSIQYRRLLWSPCSFWIKMYVTNIIPWTFNWSTFQGLRVKMTALIVAPALVNRKRHKSEAELLRVPTFLLSALHFIVFFFCHEIGNFSHSLHVSSVWCSLSKLVWDCVEQSKHFLCTRCK